VDEVAQLIAAQPQVSEIDVEKGRVRFVLAGDDHESARLLGQVVAAGTEVAEWRVDAAGLEELFLQITADDEDEQS
jgi:ABC-type uncharacterized transport system ATPase subunit